MRWITAILVCASLALAQDVPPAPRSNWNAAKAQSGKQGTEALARERARSKANLCAEAEKGGNAGIAQCLTNEGKVTEQSYRAYIRAIGQLLRLPAKEKSAQSTQKLPFERAEEAWQTYRDRSCTSVATQWDGGDQAPVAYSDCRPKLTWNRMNELADLYSDLWH